MTMTMTMTMTKRSLATFLLAAIALLALVVPSHAAGIWTSWDYQSVSPLETTNWDHDLTLNKFDTNLGTLLGVEFSLEGGVEGVIAYESKDAAPSVVTATLQALLTLKSSSDPAATLATVLPAISKIDTLTAYDGAVDFGGTSGKTYASLSTYAAPITTDDNAHLAFYNGPGTFAVNLAATGTSTATGAGNLITDFTTMAGGKVGVRYLYETSQTPVPEPASLALLGLGGAFGLAYRRRQRLAAGR